jgi:hypothetical protein
MSSMVFAQRGRHQRPFALVEHRDQRLASPAVQIFRHAGCVLALDSFSFGAIRVNGNRANDAWQRDYPHIRRQHQRINPACCANTPRALLRQSVSPSTTSA